MIDSKLNEYLKQKYSPEGSELRKMQLRLLEMLLWIDNVCKEYNINYWISSGTCLGAVRHGGFIPWDDDVDIEMTLDDYLKFEKVVLEMPDIPYIIQNHKTDPNYYYCFSKLRDESYKIAENNKIDEYYNYRGLFIDIFIVIPKIQHWISRIGEIWVGRCRTYSRHPNQIVRKFVRYALFPLGVYGIKPILYLFKKENIKEYVMQFGMSIWKPRFVNDIQKPIPILFEGHYIMGPNQPDKYLTKIYGDYMKIPEDAEIINHFYTTTEY